MVVLNNVEIAMAACGSSDLGDAGQITIDQWR
jgi:hypothetical protein